MKLDINGVDLAAVITSELDALRGAAVAANHLATQLEAKRSQAHASARRIQTLLDLASSFEVDGIDHNGTLTAINHALTALPLSPRKDR